MSAFAVVLEVTLVALLLVRQRRIRPVRPRLALRLPIILGLIGLWQLLDFTNHRHLAASVVAVLLGSLVVGAGLLGALRAATVHIWAQSPFVLRQGTWVTMGLWVVSLALHFAAGWAIAALNGPDQLASASLVLYLGITYGVQTAVVHHRAERVRATLGPIDAASTVFGGGPGVRAFWFGSGGPGGWAPGTQVPGPGQGPTDTHPGGPVIDAQTEALPPGPDDGTGPPG